VETWRLIYLLQTNFNRWQINIGCCSKMNFFWCIVHTVIIFLTRNGRIRPVKFRPKNFGRISCDLGELSPNQQILRLNNRRNSLKSEEIRPKFLRANLNCADSPGSPEKISTVHMDGFRMGEPKMGLMCFPYLQFLPSSD
jgi:hypothetical protein